MIRSRALLVIAAALVLGGCGATTIQGNAAMAPVDLTTVAGLPLTHGPSGMREGAPPADIAVEGDSDDEVDRIAKSAIADLQTFWDKKFPEQFHKSFKHLDRLISWDASDQRARGPAFCGESTTGIANAGYCHDDNELGWDRRNLMGGLNDRFGPLAVATVLAHEYGHAVQYQTGADVPSMPAIVAEQQADCYAGVFMREVAAGNAEHFTMNTSDGLGTVLSAMVSTRDNPSNGYFAGSEHGSAFERVTAFQLGFAGDPQRCAAINADDVDSRRGNLPLNVLMAGDHGDMPITQESLGLMAKSLGTFFELPEAPQVSYSGVDVGCAEKTSPVTYCPAGNTIGVDLPRLVEESTPERARRDLPTEIVGDFTGFGMFASRFALAAQSAQGLPIDGPSAALRTTCLVGAWTGAVANQPDGSVQLSPGDLDEAISALLDDGLMAGDVNGDSVDSGFARVEAFRTGMLGGSALCAQSYR